MVEVESALSRVIKLFLLKAFTNWCNSFSPEEQRTFVLVVLLLTLISVAAYAISKLPQNDFYSLCRGVAVRVGRPITLFLIRSFGPWIEMSSKLNGLIFLPILLLLMAAFGSWPYNFYVLVRICTCITFAALALTLAGPTAKVWQVALSVFAFIFNPFAPFHMYKDTWAVLNTAGAFLLLPAGLTYLANRKTIPKQVLVVHDLKYTAKVSKSNPKYLYCSECTKRVGAEDVFCKSCGKVFETT